MHLIAYISEYTGSEDKAYDVLRDIVSVARKENAKYGITGVLFFIDSKFLQIIEGYETPLRRLMTNIEKDERHRNIEYLIDVEVPAKGFDGWNMDSFVLDGKHVFDADTLKKLTDTFRRNILPRSDVLAHYYKKLLEQQTV